MRKISEDDFERKYYNYKDTIYSIALNYCHDEDDALDITQDVFMKYLSDDKQFENDNHELYWLIRVAINTSLTFIKSKWKTSVYLNEELLNKAKDENLSDDILRMRQILNSLPDKYKEVIILYYYQNYNVNEIANILNISLSNVKKRLERAREIIKKEY